MIKLEELKVYKVAMEIGEIVWSIVDKWTYFQKDTSGKQFTRKQLAASKSNDLLTK